MANYVLAYRGKGMPETEAERDASMKQWGVWFGTLGDAVVDGGNPFGPSLTVGSDGSTSESAPSELTGYSILSADSLETAATLAKGCPVLAGWGTVDVYETFPVM